MQIARDEANFKDFMDKLRVEKERDETRKKTSHENKYRYRGEILSQITEKQRKRREEEDRQKREQLAQIESERQREQLSLFLYSPFPVFPFYCRLSQMLIIYNPSYPHPLPNHHHFALYVLDVIVVNLFFFLFSFLIQKY